MRSISILALGIVASLSAVACGGVRDEEGGDQSSALSEASTPRQGSSIQSPSVSANKMYWGSRSIEILQRVGYLTDAEAQLAKRADGIIDNSPPNGRIGVDELAALESPQHMATLFPQEKATIPKLWKILEISAATAAAPPSLTIAKNVVDTYSVSPFALPIAQLPAPLQTLAQRVQLTENADGNAQTISGTDIAKAYKNKGSYLPAEVQQFATIALLIAQGAPQLGPDVQRVEVTSPVPGTANIASAAGANLVAETTVNVTGGYQPGASPVNLPSVVANTALRVTLPANVFAVVLDPVSGADALQTASNTFARGKTRLEIWSGGNRAGDFEVNAPQQVNEPIPFGYSVKVGSAMFRIQPGATYTYIPVQNGALPTQQAIPPTAYAVVGSPTNARLDLFATGRAVIVENGKTVPCYPSAANYLGHLQSCFTVNSTGGKLASYAIGQHLQPDGPEQGYQSAAGQPAPSLFAY